MPFKCKEGENRKDSRLFLCHELMAYYWQKLIQK